MLQFLFFGVCCWVCYRYKMKITWLLLVQANTNRQNNNDNNKLCMWWLCLWLLILAIFLFYSNRDWNEITWAFLDICAISTHSFACAIIYVLFTFLFALLMLRSDEDKKCDIVKCKRASVDFFFHYIFTFFMRILKHHKFCLLLLKIKEKEEKN